MFLNKFKDQLCIFVKILKSHVPLHRATRFFREALIQCQPLVKDLHGAEPFSPTCFGESLIRTKRVGVASSKQLPLAPIDEKEIELEKSKEDFDPVS